MQSGMHRLTTCMDHAVRRGVHVLAWQNAVTDFEFGSSL